MIAGFVGAWYVGERMVFRRGSMLLRSSPTEAESEVDASPWREDLVNVSLPRLIVSGE